VTRFDEYSRLARVLVHPAAAAFTPERIEQQWRALNFTAPPDPGRAAEEHAAFAKLLASAGATVEVAPDAPGLTLDAIYARDASVISPRGVILSRMGKPARAHEPAAQRRVFERLGVPIAGTIEPPGLLEGGDVVWFDERTVAVGRGYRTNDAGIAQLKGILGPEVDVMVAALPHHRGPADVFHLMSVISPVDASLAVVYSPLMPVAFREWLLSRGMTLVEVPPEEFDLMGANVLALAPRRCVMVDGAPITRARLEAADVDVLTYAGVEISLKGGGGPTCLTRPLTRLHEDHEDHEDHEGRSSCHRKRKANSS
jgi:N-dimethylarginine dimethylaminohydrolase